MFKLYTIANPKLIDTNNSKDKLLVIMNRMLKVNPEERFLLVEREGNTDKWFKGIYGIEEYNKYLNELENERLKNLTCMELKEEIIKIKEKKI